MDLTINKLLETNSKRRNIDLYKNFIQLFRRLSLEDHHLLLGEAVTPKLNEYVRNLINIKFEDGKYHAYYGEIKKVINSFMNYIFHTTDEIIVEADRYSQVATREELLDLADKTINVYQVLLIDFGKEYLPVTTADEKQNYDEISDLHNVYMKNIHDLREMIEKLDKQDKINAFIKDHFKTTVKKTYEKFQFSHAYLAMMLSEHLTKIKISLEEILLRMRNNLRYMQQASDDTLSTLLNELYDKNKEHLQITRRDKRSSIDEAEVTCDIEKIRKKIENHDTNTYLIRVQEEVEYWEGRLREFEAITQNLAKLKAEEDNCIRQEKIYNDMKSTELPGRKLQCWETLGGNFKQRKEYIKQKYMEESRSLISFFCIRGTDRIIYKNDIGSYQVDELNHQIYQFDHGTDIFHVNCDGRFMEISDKEIYYYDENGRYIYENGEKLYQSMPCASKYKLDSDTLLVKVTADCGHADRGNEKCKMAINDLTDVEMLPTVEPIDISRTLNSETVNYLWKSFGALLPEALHDVGVSKSKNPIHVLAHKLLAHKYSRTLGELRKKNKEADDFKTELYRERREKAVAASKAWKAKQVKQRKPEESDDTLHWATLNAYNAEREFIISQDFFNT